MGRGGFAPNVEPHPMALMDSRFGQYALMTVALGSILSNLYAPITTILGVANAPIVAVTTQATRDISDIRALVVDLTTQFKLMPRPGDFQKYETAIAQNQRDISATNDRVTVVDKELTRVATIVDRFQQGADAQVRTPRSVGRPN